MGAVAAIGRLDLARRRVEPEHALLARGGEAPLDRHRHGADRAMAAHRQAAARLDEEDADIAIRARGGSEDAARHHVVAARLEHEPGTDPVVVGEEMLPALA